MAPQKSEESVQQKKPVKTKSTEWARIFAGCTSDRGLIFRVHKELKEGRKEEKKRRGGRVKEKRNKNKD